MTSKSTSDSLSITLTNRCLDLSHSPDQSSTYSTILSSHLSPTVAFKTFNLSHNTTEAVHLRSNIGHPHSGPVGRLTARLRVATSNTSISALGMRFQSKWARAVTQDGLMVGQVVFPTSWHPNAKFTCTLHRLRLGQFF